MLFAMCIKANHLIQINIENDGSNDKISFYKKSVFAIQEKMWTPRLPHDLPLPSCNLGLRCY